MKRLIEKLASGVRTVAAGRSATTSFTGVLTGVTVATVATSIGRL